MESTQDLYSEIKVVLGLTGRMGIMVNEQPLNDEDSLMVKTWLLLQACLIYDILPNPNKSMRSYKSWLGQAVCLDIYAFGTFQKVVSMLLRRYPELYEMGEKWDRQQFKQAVPSNSKTYWGFISPVFDLLDEFLELPGARTLQILLQWVDFSIKINLKSVDYSSVMLPEYYEAEAQMSAWSYDSTADDLNVIMREWLADYNYNEFCPKHGPGSVAEYEGRNVGIAAKFAAFKTDARLDYFCNQVIGVPFEEWMPSITDSNADVRQKGIEWRTSELILVPKSMITNRLISKEPAVLQYFQQGVSRCTNEYIRNHPFLRRIYCRERQDLSQRMAWDGSMFGDYATIDLSAASDSVTLELVKRVFRGTALLPGLICTRSDYTLMPDGTKLKLAKFAPMGSCNCFDTEVLVFSAICELARRKTGSRKLFRVFGDDIVCPREYAKLVLKLLARLHFKVNEKKSYSNSVLLNFREACGGEFFNGEDVCPLRLSRGWQIASFRDIKFLVDGKCQYRRMSPKEYCSNIGLINRLFEKGFFTTRRVLTRMLKNRLSFQYYWNRTWCDELGGRFGIAVRPGYGDNYHLISRYDRDLQCLVYSIGRFPVEADWDADEEEIDSPADLELLSEESTLYKSAKSACYRLGWQQDEAAYYEWLRRSTVTDRKLLCDHISGLYEPLQVEITAVWPSRQSKSLKTGWQTSKEVCL